MLTSHKKNIFFILITFITIILFCINAKSEKNKLTSSYYEGISKINSEEYQDAKKF